MQRTIIASRISIFLALSFLVWGMAVAPISAQTTTIAVEPDQVSVPLGNQFQIEITVTDGVNVNAFDVRITYNQQRLSLASWAHGDYLSAVSCLNEIKSPGLLELGCTQLGQSPVSGDGVLLVLDFNTDLLGQAEITLEEAVFADGRGVQSQPEKIDGVVLVQSESTYTPTPTLTLTPTWTLTPTFTQTPTPVTPTETSVNPTATSTPESLATATLTSAQETEGTQVVQTSTTTPRSGLIAPPTETPTPEAVSQAGTDISPSGDEETAQNQTQIAQMPAGDDPNREGPSGEDSPESSKTRDQASPQSARPSAVWNGILLGLLAFSTLAMVVMTIILIRRRTQEEEDLLL